MNGEAPTGGEGSERRGAFPVLAVLIAIAAVAGLLMIARPSSAVTLNAACQQDHNIEVERDGQVIEDMTLLNARESAVLIDGFDNVTVRDVTISGYDCDGSGPQNEAGIACWQCSGLTVEDVTIERATGGGNGIWVKNSGGGNVIRDNTISGGFDGIGGEDEFSPTGSFNRDTVIEGNTISDCDDDGIQSEGGNDGVVIRDNTISGCLIGIAFAPNLAGLLNIEDNAIRDVVPRRGNDPACWKEGGVGAGTTQLLDNVCTTEQGDGFKQSGGFGHSVVIARDNCIQAGRYVIETFEPGPLDFDGDRLWTTDPNRFIKWADSLYGSLSSFRSATGLELSGVEAEGCGGDDDGDSDGFSEIAETFIGTEPQAGCAETATANDEPGPDAWPLDSNDDQIVDPSDSLAAKPYMNKTSPDAGYDPRFDLHGQDGTINLFDMLPYKRFFLQSCAQ
jgi:parallel beta-helix repeat protein